MNFDFVTNNENCFNLVTQTLPTSLIYYSHFPPALVGLFVSVFVFLKSKRSLAGKILLVMSATFAMWAGFDLVLWTGFDTRLTMMFWAPFGMLFCLIFSLAVYFTYVFLDNKDISSRKKALIFTPAILAMMLTPTVFNLSVFDDTNCEAVEASWFVNAYSLYGLIAVVWIAALVVMRYRSARKTFRKQIVLFAFGIEFFLFSFFATSYLASLIGNFYVGIYGLFGMPIFMALLAYLIVAYRAFNIRLLGTQTLVITITLLIAAQFFFVKTLTNQVLTAITLCLVITSGVLLIRSFKRSEHRKDQLQVMADRLSITNARLRELDNAKTEFISIASHQLRTPLTSINGYCSLVLEGTYGAVSDAVKEVVHRIMISNNRLVGLVENLLSVSRMESGRMEYQMEAFRLEDILRELIDSFAFTAKNKHLELSFDGPSEPLPTLLLDKQKMQEVFSNLIDNAIKYTNEGSVRVSVSRNPKTGRICAVVKDSGIGIPQDEKQYLFAKFSRGKDINRLHANGTGLGLYVAKAIVEAHKGTIRIESEGAGKGTSFIVEFGS
jgi:signal transduction histidine kinase